MKERPASFVNEENHTRPGDRRELNQQADPDRFAREGYKLRIKERRRSRIRSDGHETLTEELETLKRITERRHEEGLKGNKNNNNKEGKRREEGREPLRNAQLKRSQLAD